MMLLQFLHFRSYGHFFTLFGPLVFYLLSPLESVYGPSLHSAIKLSKNSMKYLMPILGDIEWYGHGPAAKAGNCTRHDCTKKSNITGLAIHEHFMSETKLRN